MKNSLISICIFIVLIGFLLYADISFKNLCTDIIHICDIMEDTIENSDQETNFKISMDLFNMIQKRGSIAAIYINHIDYDVLLNEALKLNVYIQEDDSAEAAASLHLLKYNTMNMKELQVPNIQNIF